jgi:hypothetical protein
MVQKRMDLEIVGQLCLLAITDMMREPFIEFFVVRLQLRVLTEPSSCHDLSVEFDPANFI